ncbi:molecular chaperone HscC [Paenibacillus radicis (ex Gao et al. 2016)]|uniref:Chaperone protein DnaK n=1 Tax=Paenibacillus radicis (ex Gao et al. 2016) TaxID=1737354 RepID=A0A917LZB4_9BACL|nr:molecular chaperone HscC [Paenibacillus radicis (ex Gao et al. 2016)]GGG65490.1 molecular chaperone HscC [Paenibacillus radicis (ex Gao et al. 2016)]
MTIIGIDLGTTNSLVAYWTETGPAIIPNVLGEASTPSVVSLDENGEILIGQVAKERLVTHPALSAATFKRYIGTEKRYRMGAHTFTPEELSSFVIRSLKSDAEAFFGREVTEAVISVPAYFNDTQRKATKQAAELAGLKVERLISEPTAAAIAYGLNQQQSDTKFLVFDLGGGTFDVSILEFFEGIMEVKSIAGDNYLGGEDFTQLLVSHFIESHTIDFHTLDLKARSLLLKQAELCKLAISNGKDGKMSFKDQSGSYETILTRSDFERIAGQLVLRLRHPIERALRDASLSPNELDAVILIGGATRMPIIKSIVAKIFGRLPFTEINPDEAVALGAAIQVALKQRNQDLSEIILTDVCPYTLGIETSRQLSSDKIESGHFSPIIERNNPIPVSRVERYQTVHNQQKIIEVAVYQGESRKIENNLMLGELEIDVPPGPAGEQSIDVRFTYDINGILEVEVTTVSTGTKKKIIIEKEPGKFTQQEIEDRLKQLHAIKIHPRERTENRLLVAMGERLYEEMLGDKRDEVAALLTQFERVLTSQNEHDVKKAAIRLKQQLEEIERWRDY